MREDAHAEQEDLQGRAVRNEPTTHFFRNLHVGLLEEDLPVEPRDRSTGTHLFPYAKSIR